MARKTWRAVFAFVATMLVAGGANAVDVTKRSIERSYQSSAVGLLPPPKIAPRSPWQNPYVERLIGSIRRECLDHEIVVDESSLRRVLNSYFEYYDPTRTHLSLDKDAPVPWSIQAPELGRIVELPQVGGLHHRYERRAA